MDIKKVMEHKGFFAKVMEAPRLVGDQVFGLPPGEALPVYHADAFKSYPENWMKGPGVFVVPVKPNKGLWFDWRDNDENNTAVIPTVKGCNPITGLQTTGFHLEKYENKCPKHGCDFQAERFCPECGYNWPDRGYVSGSPLWWDGFRSEGDVRQFFFTEEMMRDVATHMIGKENTVPAFGFAFYSPKERRPTAQTVIYKTSYPEFNYHSYPIKYFSSSAYDVKGTAKGIGLSGGLLSSELKSKSLIPGARLRSASKTFSDISDGTLGGSLPPDNASFCYSSQAAALDSLDLGQERGITLNECAAVPVAGGASVEVRQEFVPQREVAVGAGAKIRQELPKDSYSLDSWKDKPDSVMTVYFVFQEEFERMASAGFKDFKDCKDGMLAGLPVG